MRMSRVRARARGMTLIEIMVASGLAAIVTAFLLMLVRGNLIAYAMNDQVVKTQQNARSGLAFLETSLRRACGGVNTGRVAVNVPGAPQVLTACLRVWDGALTAGGSFTTGGTPAAKADAVEIVYGGAPFMRASGPLDTATPAVAVADTTGFAAEDLVLVTNFQQAVLVKIRSITPGVPGTLTFYSPGGGLLLPNAIGPVPAYTPAAGDTVMKAESVALYVETAAGPFKDMLMLDPNGMAGGDHADAEPLLEGVEDLQLAIGVDANGDGVLTDTPLDEYLGNQSGELVPPAPALPWNQLGTAKPRNLRATLIVRTTSSYPGAGNLTPPYENRVTYTPPTGGGSYRFRPLRITVAPRIWNLQN